MLLLTIWAAAETDPPWAAIIASAAVLLTAYVTYASYRQRKIVEQGQREIEAVRLGQGSLEAALARADLVVARQDRDLASQAAELRTLRADLDRAMIQIREMTEEMVDERRRHKDRVGSLRRQIRLLGGTPEGDLDATD